MKIVMKDADKIDGRGELVKCGDAVEVSDGEGEALIAAGRADPYKEPAAEKPAMAKPATEDKAARR
jgi:hypothetical protein